VPLNNGSISFSWAGRDSDRAGFLFQQPVYRAHGGYYLSSCNIIKMSHNLVKVREKPEPQPTETMATLKTKKDTKPAKAEYEPYPLAAPITGDADVDGFAKKWIEEADWHECEEHPDHAEAAVKDRKFWSYYKKTNFKEAMREVGYRIQKRDKTFYIIAADPSDVPVKLSRSEASKPVEAPKEEPAPEGKFFPTIPSGDTYSCDAKLKAVIELVKLDHEPSDDSIESASGAVKRIIEILEA